MVNVGDKNVTQRRARARGYILLKEAYGAVRSDQLKKGSALECARIAAILGAKKTADLIPLCHTVALTSISIDFSFDEKGLWVTVTVETHDRTGVEMEALTAVSMALLTIYDMAKAIEKSMEIADICLVEKSGGRSDFEKK